MYYAKLGGEVSQQSKAKSRSQSSVTNEELASSSERGFSMGWLSTSKSESKSSSTTNAEGQTKGVETEELLFRGGVPNGDYAEWCASVKTAPIPIEYSVVPNTYLIGTVLGEVRLAAKMNHYLTVERPKAAASCVPGTKWNKRTGECDPADCPKGYVKLADPKDPQKLCDVCPPGKYLQSTADTECQECAAGYFAPYEASTECEVCASGKYSNEGAKICDQLKGAYAIQLGTNKEASLTKASQGKGDGSIPGGDKDSRWAYWDKKSSQQRLQISPVPGKKDSYYVQSGSFYLDATRSGDRDKAGSRYWAYFGSDKAEVKLQPVDKDQMKYVLLYGNNYKITDNPNGDNDKQYGRSRRRKKYNGKSPWASFSQHKDGNVVLHSLSILDGV
jgi:hypothetical protein